MSELKGGAPPYERTAHYYETDRMGIIHHSNYIRWFEEARIYFLEKAGYPYAKMESDGIMIPVLSASCEYKNAVRFDETVLINLEITEFNGFKMTIRYTVSGKNDGTLKAVGETRHFFVTGDMKPVRVKKDYPEIYRVFNDNREEQCDEKN